MTENGDTCFFKFIGESGVNRPILTSLQLFELQRFSLTQEVEKRLWHCIKQETKTTGNSQ